MSRTGDDGALVESENPSYVILGSGGHTGEMCKIIQALLDQSNTGCKIYQPIRYIVAKTDATSKRKVQIAMSKLGLILDDDAFLEVPRSREVGQSWFTTIFTTLWAILWCFRLLWKDRPKLILCNGPGTCVPFCYVAYLLRLIRRLPRNARIVFVESFCRVKSLSLSGGLLLPIADLIVVQWPTLAKRFPDKRHIKYFGKIM